jgi:hypothetical protein
MKKQATHTEALDPILSEIFRDAGWKVRSRLPGRVTGKDGRQFAVTLKKSPEGRRDRLVPLLSQAILEARTSALQSTELVTPLAIVAAPRVSSSLADQIIEFAKRHAPEIGAGVVDSEGLRVFNGRGLEILDSPPTRRPRYEPAQPKRLPGLFSDLNQWMLKVLLGQRLPQSLISVPRGTFRNATQLARAANVSVMSAFRFVSQLANEGFLDRQSGELKIVRVGELLNLWSAAARQSATEVPVRWVLRKGKTQLRTTLRQYLSETGPAQSKPRRGRPARILASRCCIGLFAAADALGLGFVHGVPPHILLDEMTGDAMDHLGLQTERSGRTPDALVRVPYNREAVFRAAVERDGMLVSDVLQVWLDACTYPSRGHEQALIIRKRAFAPLLAEP